MSLFTNMFLFCFSRRRVFIVRSPVRSRRHRPRPTGNKYGRTPSGSRLHLRSVAGTAPSHSSTNNLFFTGYPVSPGRAKHSKRNLFVAQVTSNKCPPYILVKTAQLSPQSPPQLIMSNISQLVMIRFVERSTRN